ncbi:hypothetical protein [Kribbella antibiotica]|uniref:hypothetical protein n=1 Tax=Kribbella antibiotica TaxID=190195 RepID=UPI0014055942|nr:hypothetical protein [Kribbella antibiotica]
MFDSSFGERVRALLRVRPVADAAANTGRQSWGDRRYDVVTMALAGIDAVIARQGLDDEVGYDEVVAGLEELAAATHPECSVEEHASVARYVLDALLNRRDREAPYRYYVSVFSRDETGTVAHRELSVEFRLLTEHEEPARGVNVLRATPDAINALVGGLEFDVEDEQAAVELMLARQLERGAFGQAEKAAERSRLLSVRYADELRALMADTSRDIRAVLGQWSSDVPQQLERSRVHLEDRLAAEARLLDHVRGALDGAESEPSVTSAAVRIAGLLEECRRRHTELHGKLVNARMTFIDEQTRQMFRPLGGLRNPDLTDDVFLPLLRLPVDAAVDPAETFAVAIAGTQVPRIVRLADLVDDLMAPRRSGDIDEPLDPDEEPGDPEPPAVPVAVLIAAAAVVDSVQLPARLSVLLTAAESAVLPAEVDRKSVLRVIALAALWSYAPESVEDFAAAVDAAAQVLGSTVAIDADGTPLRLDGWSGDDLIVAEDEESLAAWAEAALSVSKGER